MDLQLILFDPPKTRLDLLPLTFTRPISGLRTGILTIAEKWERRLGMTAGFLTSDHLRPKFAPPEHENYLVINGSILPEPHLVEVIRALPDKVCLEKDGVLLGLLCSHPELELWKTNQELPGFSSREFEGPIQRISYPWDLFVGNAHQLQLDFQLLTSGRRTLEIEDPYTRVYNPEDVFVEPGVKIRAAVINAEEGPVYLGEGSEIQEGAVIRGPVSLGDHSIVSMGSKIRGDVTIGPSCKVGGEVIHSVIQGFSNKGHDGFLGCSVIGEWCNLGADSNTSNLKNNYAEVRLWNYPSGKTISSGRQFLGLIMGDHSKCGINTMFNTGTVVGVSANIFGTGFPPAFVPSFSWGGIQGFDTFRLEKAMEVAGKMMERRQKKLDQAEQEILGKVFHQTAEWRHWEERSAKDS